MLREPVIYFQFDSTNNTNINTEVDYIWKEVRPLSIRNELRRTTKGHDIFPYQYKPTPQSLNTRTHIQTQKTSS